MRTLSMLLVAALTSVCTACGDDESEAVRLGVGAACTDDTQCTEANQHCLTEFRGGYCGVEDCTADVDCPTGSACVTEDDGHNYCFLVCANKPECNVHRSLDNESNCVASLPFVDAADGRKVCRPPLSGTRADAGAQPDAATD